MDSEGPTPASSDTVTPTPPTPPVKADAMARFLAYLIDAVAVAVVSSVPLVGALAGTAYALVRDGLDVDFMRQRSLGKRVMKLRPVRLDGQPMDISTSVRRNWPLAIGSLASFFLYIPLIGLLLFPLLLIVGLGIWIYEGYRVYNRPDGRRWGDELAGTQVIAADD
jgi:uncharacterized RDD family membrane protein YckC